MSPDPIQPPESLDEEESETLESEENKTCKGTQTEEAAREGGHVEMEEETEPYSVNQGMSGIAFVCQKLEKVGMDSSPGPWAGA